MLVGSVISNHMLDHQIQYLFPLFIAQCLIHLRKPSMTLPPSHTKVITQSCMIMQGTQSALHTALKAQIFISKPVQDISKLWLKSSAINSADLNVNTVIAEGEEPFLSPSFRLLMLRNTELDSAALSLREVSSQWDCSEKRGLRGCSQEFDCPCRSMHNYMFSFQAHIYTYYSLNMLLIFRLYWNFWLKKVHDIPVDIFITSKGASFNRL